MSPAPPTGNTKGGDETQHKHAAACSLISFEKISTCIYYLNLAWAVPVVGAGDNPAWLVVPP